MMPELIHACSSPQILVDIGLEDTAFEINLVRLATITYGLRRETPRGKKFILFFVNFSSSP